MHVLFVHPNFPAQFRHVASRFAADFDWTCTFATTNDRAEALPAVERVIYRPHGAKGSPASFTSASFESGLAHARGVYDALKSRRDVRPDLVVAHSGFGSSLFLPYVYDAPIINFFEYFYRPVGQDLEYRPELSVTEPMLLRSKARNAMILLDLDNCDRGWCPNESQRSLFPREYLPKIDAIPEGIDTALWRRRADARLTLGDGTPLPPGTRVVTYVSRGFELMRGFDIFMEVAKRIVERVPEVVFVVVGSDRVYYGGEASLVEDGKFGRHVLRSGKYDLSRFCFPGQVPQETLAEILSVTDLHVYLTVPFVSSWSLLNAMACGATVLASDQACVREYISHGRNGLLRDFFDVEGLAEQAVAVLNDPSGHRHLGDAARQTIEETYALDVTLPRLKAFFEQVASKGPRVPSLRAERLVRPGTLAPSNGAKSQRPRRPWSGQVEVGLGHVGDVPRASAAPVQARTVFATSEEGERTGLKCAGPTPRRNQSNARTVLFCWEMGGGLGHMVQMLPLADRLVRNGHRVFVALRSLSGNAAEVFSRCGAFVLQAPHAPLGAPTGRPTYNFAQLLAAAGWGTLAALRPVASGWRNLMVMARADLIVFDHSPTALLASRGLPTSRTLIGSGFCCPPDTGAAPMPMMLPAGDADGVSENERRVLDRTNRVLRDWRQPRLERLGQLYSDVDENFLTTLPELDQYPPELRGRCGPAVRYWGPVLDGGGDAPEWPDGDGKRVFAYLKPFKALPDLLALLNESCCPTLAYVDGLTESMRQQFESPTLRLARGRQDLAAAARQCDLAVLNAGQGSTAAMLLAGVPLLLVPLV
ncbi:MAG TPA: glycosyltransferase, partial [Tepidisphaeraceae bacterium]|nr:glycosyltransferase [Tepidisphaeraceae bacterium]